MGTKPAKPCASPRLREILADELPEDLRREFAVGSCASCSEALYDRAFGDLCEPCAWDRFQTQRMRWESKAGSS